MNERIRILARFCLILCISGAALIAGDDLFFVSPQLGDLIISEEELLANDPTALGITGYKGPLRGILSFHEGVVVYTPLEAFWDWGIDAFQYTITEGTSASDVPVTVYLAADDGEVKFAEDFEALAVSADWGIVNGSGALQISSHDPIDGQASLVADLSIEGIAHITNLKPADSRPDGKVGEGLDPDDPDIVGRFGDVVFMRGVTLEQQPVFEVSLSSIDQERQLCPRAWQADGSSVSAPCASIPNHPVQIILGWARMPDPEPQVNGFVYLLVDGSLVAQIKNLDNSGLSPAFWSFGMIQSDSGLEGRIQLDNLQIWTNPER